MTKHTPSPWAYHFEPTLNRHIVRAGFAGEHNICVAYGAGLKSYEAAANMRLIAAAPDLLEALLEAEAALNAIERWCGHGMLTGHRAKVWNCVGDRLEKIRSAIAKARGSND